MAKYSGAKTWVRSPVVLQLVDRFDQHKASYRRHGYHETQVRREFIDPFFEALGWDVDNKAGHAEAYKDVIHEDAIKVGGATKAPDYCFRIGGVRKFFVEAKKPSVEVKDDPGPAYQLRRYAWTNKLPLSIVTDFEEFGVYDCRIKPQRTDKPSAARVMYLTYDEYSQRWDEIASIFAKDAILTGSFDKYAESTKRKRGTAEVDAEFLKEIERWRELLARNIALRNPALSVREMNYAVSKTIDRIIFLRMCEDRGIETYAHLRGLLNGPNIYKRLVELFYRADERYNSGLFYFQPERGRADTPDDLTPGLVIDDRVLKEIIKGLYYPECPYEFSVLPADILGQVYEQFLGKVIRLTKGHRAVVEEKPEVKKAGGVYYTPTYIVDYIVKHTVGKLLEGRSVKWIGRERNKTVNRPRLDAPLRVLDPACGSGSFLLGAYECLLRWHLDYYTSNDPEAWARRPNPPIYQIAGSGGWGPGSGADATATPHTPHPKPQPPTWRLTIAERKRILLEHIFGVDIDPQAVEVTKLSLLLKVLEGESQQTLDNQLRLFHERALPDLAGNIKCGNSLIGPDFYDNQQMTLLDEEERYRINVFDWHAEFPDVFAGDNPGFDSVIGNPPWGARFTDVELTYLKAKYARVVDRMVDSYIYFMDRAVRLARHGDPVGFIVPSTILNQSDATSLRRLLLSRRLTALVNLGKGIFGSSVLNTSTIVVSGAPEAVRPLRLDDLSAVPLQERATALDGVASSEWSDWRALVESDPHNTFFAGNLPETMILNRLQGRFPALQEILSGTIQRGVSPDVAAAHVVSHDDLARAGIEAQLLRPSISGPKIKRYSPCRADQWIVYTTKNISIERFPGAFEHLKRYRHLNTCREAAEGKHPWWSLHRPRNPAIFDAPKLIGLTTTKTIELVYDAASSLYVTDAMYVVKVRPEHDIRAVMAILQSRLFLFLYRTGNQGESRVIPQVKASKLQSLPFPPSAKQEPTFHRLSTLAQANLDLHQQFSTARTPVDKTAIQRQIEATDQQIDQLVYDLYGLTHEEITIVEQAGQR